MKQGKNESGGGEGQLLSSPDTDGDRDRAAVEVAVVVRASEWQQRL